MDIKFKLDNVKRCPYLKVIDLHRSMILQLHLELIGFQHVVWIRLVQNRDKNRAFVYRVLMPGFCIDINIREKAYLHYTNGY